MRNIQKIHVGEDYTKYAYYEEDSINPIEVEITGIAQGIINTLGKSLKKRSFLEECLGCGEPQSNHPAMSRYDHGDICSDCGMREAIEGDFIKNN